MRCLKLSTDIPRIAHVNVVLFRKAWSASDMCSKSLAHLVFLAGLLSACAPQDVVETGHNTQDVPARRAFFESSPDVLHTLFRESCVNPGDRYTRPNSRTAQCKLLPTPEGAAFLLTQFDAKLELPKLVIQTVTRESGEGYEVEMSYFAEIRAKTGNRQRIYMARESLDRQIDLILANSGGKPL